MYCHFMEFWWKPQEKSNHLLTCWLDRRLQEGWMSDLESFVRSNWFLNDGTHILLGCIRKDEIDGNIISWAQCIIAEWESWRLPVRISPFFHLYKDWNVFKYAKTVNKRIENCSIWCVCLCKCATDEFELVTLPDLPDWTEKSRHSCQDDKF